jgi:hypothetical protein
LQVNGGANGFRAALVRIYYGIADIGGQDT